MCYDASHIMDNKSCLAIIIDVNHTSFLRLVVSDLCNYNIVELFSSYIFFLREVLSETLRGQKKKNYITIIKLYLGFVHFIVCKFIP